MCNAVLLPVFIFYDAEANFFSSDIRAREYNYVDSGGKLAVQDSWLQSNQMKTKLQLWQQDTFSTLCYC